VDYLGSEAVHPTARATAAAAGEAGMISRGVRLEEKGGNWTLYFQVGDDEYNLGKLDTPEVGDELTVRIKFTRATKPSGEPDLLAFVEVESPNPPTEVAGTRHNVRKH
jgi:hypothetical protein